MTESIPQDSTSGTGNAGDIPTGGSFAKTPIGAVLRNTNLSDGAVRLYAELRSYAWGEDGRCFPGQKTLGEDMGWSRKKVYRYTKELKDADLIEIEYRPLHKGKNKPNLYTLNQPSTSGTDGSSMTHRDGSSLTHEVDLVEVDIPPTPPTEGGGKEEKKKGKAGTGTAGTASFGDKRDPAQNRASEGRDGKRPRAKRKPRGGVTSPAGIEAIRSFQARTEGLDYTGWKVKRVKMRLAEIAEHWDFASKEDPPMKVRRQISPDAESCDEILKRLRKTLNQAATSAEVDALNAKKQRGHDHVSPEAVPTTAQGNVEAEDFEGTDTLPDLRAEDRAREAEEAAILKWFRETHPEECAFDGF